jgi:hypothetical protein
MLKPVLLLSGSGSAVSEMRVTLLKRDPTAEGAMLPAILIVSLSPALIVLKVH